MSEFSGKDGEGFGIVRFRQPHGLLSGIVKFLLITLPVIICLWVLQVPTYLNLPLYIEQIVGFCLGIALALTFILKPAGAKVKDNKIPWYDLILAALSLLVALYLGFLYPTVSGTFVNVIEWHKVTLGFITMLLILEAVRRMVGLIITVLTALFILYARFANFFPGLFQGRGMSWPRLGTSLFLETGMLLGTPVTVVTTIVTLFLLFGLVLMATGTGELVSQSAEALTGKYRGGPAKATIIGCAFMGALTGNPMATSATVGILTIPSMRRVGYSADFTAGLLATAATGAIIIPPVLGSAAFIMAEFLQIPYAAIAVAAIIPGVLYYFCLFLQTDFEAAKEGIRGLPSNEIPSLIKLTLGYWPYTIPLIVLICLLFVVNLRPELAAFYSTVAGILVSFAKKKTRLSLRRAISVLEETGRGMLDMIPVCGAAGLIVGVLSLTGAGSFLSNALVNLAGGNLILLLIFCAVVCAILGMGIPIVPIYILMSVIVAPALIKVGVPAIAAHLFIFYWANLSFITPPVMLAIFVCAPLASANQMKAAWHAMRLSIVAYIVPFAFAFDQAFLLSGSSTHIAVVTISGLFGCFLLAASIEGYMFQRLAIVQRILFGIAGLALLMQLWGWIVSLIAAIISILLLVLEYNRFKPLRKNRIVGTQAKSTPQTLTDSNPDSKD